MDTLTLQEPKKKSPTKTLFRLSASFVFATLALLYFFFLPGNSRPDSARVNKIRNRRQAGFIFDLISEIAVSELIFSFPSNQHVKVSKFAVSIRVESRLAEGKKTEAEAKAKTGYIRFQDEEKNLAAKELICLMTIRTDEPASSIITRLVY